MKVMSVLGLSGSGGPEASKPAALLDAESGVGGESSTGATAGCAERSGRVTFEAGFRN
jgi:hypothetical protein